MSGLRRHSRGSTRHAQSRKIVLDVDLNQPASVENREGGTAIVIGRASLSCRRQVAPIDVEAIEDEVVISSPRRFAEARNLSRCNHGATIVLDEDPSVRPSSLEGLGPSRRNCNWKRTSQSQVVINCDDDNDKDAANSSKRRNLGPHVNTKHVDALPKEVTFTCAVCMGTLMEPMSTICGHIFCKSCIKTSIDFQKKCPTCRRKLMHSNIHRIYLPNASLR